MKRFLWAVAMCSTSAALLLAPLTDAGAFESCQTQECTRSLECIPLCPPCNGDILIPGTCWYS